MLSHGLDLLIRPNVYSFALRAVLRMKRDDFLDGCRHAARATHAALRSSMEADDAPLSQLEADAAIAPALHAELSREISRGRDAGALDLMLATLGEQSRMLEDDVPVTLGHVRLICGTQRVSTTTMLAGSHRLHIGSHLIVIDDRDDGLWRVDRQRELLLHGGCTAQFEVSFGDRRMDTPHAPQTFLFEASAAGAWLVDGDDDERGGDDGGLAVSLADLNGITGGAFWTSAAEVRPWWQVLG